MKSQNPSIVRVISTTRMAIVFGSFLALALPVRSETAWKRPGLTDPRTVEMSGPLGDAFKSGVSRIGQAPYAASFVLADVSFTTNRWFTNYSGDISGRFLELASVTSFKGNPQPTALAGVMEQVAAYQKPDGHFGADINWTNAAELRGAAWGSKIMPILWGNGRLLLGLTAGATRFDNPRLLQAARRLGDFYVTTGTDIFCNPTRTNDYQQAADYAGMYVTCYFEGMEGLVQLYRANGDKRYLDTAVRMADFHESYDLLPVGHSHGSLSQHEALLMLYEETGIAKYLNRVVTRWNNAVAGGYVSPVGGVLEKFVATGFNRDEGCSEADWLRVNLMLWRNTGETRYLDMAERAVWNEFFGNQWADGGYGHRNMGVDATGPFGFDKYSEESLWCCSFHGPLSLNEFKSYLAVGDQNGIRYNFPIDFKASVKLPNGAWTVQSKAMPPSDGIPVRCEVVLTRQSGKGRAPLFIRAPEWAENVTVTLNGNELDSVMAGSYICISALESGSKLEIAYHSHPYLENRRLQHVSVPKTLPAQLKGMVIRSGPSVLMSTTSGDIQPLALQVKDGVLQLPQDSAKLVSWTQLKNSTNRHAYVFDVELK